ncbi:hypothetical protein MNBD_GAMMA05-596 [hydrothermal vent metagenome]|uniref:Uncharacterized protein n=1 Tax=hydrothermal vent metagenome TaxID=652676 RepID=A0A3B0WL34_9ZZZZ
MSSGYNHDFYDAQIDGSLRSAKVVVPLILDLLKIESVIDVGCGVGTWLSAYKANGITEVLGLDGDYVDLDKLKIEVTEFKATDITTDFNVKTSYDLVQSLEVAEHLDEAHAKDFVRKLVALAPVVLFSAAVPYQLGTNHVNEQLLPYWVNLFKTHDYHLIDCVRPQVWSNNDVEVCYRQNIVIFANTEQIEKNNKLKSAFDKTNMDMMSMIHPELYMPRINRLINTSFEAAQHLHKAGQLQVAEVLYRTLLNFNPHEANIWDCHGQLAAQAGNYDVALKSLIKAVECEPEVASHHFNLGQVYSFRKEISQAKKSFEKALTLQPDYPTAQQALSAITQK